jgi:hypothetical protein
MTIYETLVRAREKIDAPEKWCQHRGHVDSRVCAAVAIDAATCFGVDTYAAWVFVSDYFGRGNVSAWNDSCPSHAAMLADLDRVIEEAKRQGV